eukprot:CAMPEP_0185798668 /NCGR_PEP_ID=MMETSP1174-20130828/162270_1 /TAXON_ID=35687 /ORGANISM="Dictyocha speculum, Strain CCMP1381" /LENGTH=103 /DNA_ID=CAMNT_0028494179 /DNA_START=710 /DNA_END=1018 /DNA_ORIENTATION=+
MFNVQLFCGMKHRLSGVQELVSNSLIVDGFLQPVFEVIHGCWTNEHSVGPCESLAHSLHRVKRDAKSTNFFIFDDFLNSRIANAVESALYRLMGYELAMLDVT